MKKKKIKLSKQAMAAVKADRKACKEGRGGGIPADKAFKDLQKRIAKLLGGPL